LKQRLPPSKLRLTLVAVAFVAVVVAIASYTSQLIVPLFLGLLTWSKAWLKSLTPKLGMLIVKNSAVIQIRRFIMQASTHMLVKSHRPWRRSITALRLTLMRSVRNTLEYYLRQPLWLRSLLAIILLLLTAGSSLAVFALLVIPQPVLNWMRKQVMSLLNKLGVAQFFGAIWRFVIPPTLRHRWHMYVKWTLGRRQVSTAKTLHNSIRSRQAGNTIEK